MALYDILGSLFGQSSGSGMDFEGSTTGNSFLDPKMMALMGMAQGLTKAGAPSPYKVGLGSALSQGLGGATQGAMQGVQFQHQMKSQEEQAALRKAQADALKAKAIRDARLQQILTGGQPMQPPQPTIEKSLGGPVTMTPVGMDQGPQARPLEAPAPQMPSRQDMLRQKGQQLIEAGFLDEGKQMLESAKSLEDKAPTTRQVRIGKEQVTQEFVNGQWREVGRGPAFTDTPLVKIGEEKEFNKAVGKETGEMYAGLLKADMNAPASIAKYQRLGQLLSSVNTGKFKGTTLELKAAAKSLGIDLNALGVADDVAPSQAARALSNQIALELRNPAGGAGMPGALSDQDRNFLVQSIPGLENDPAAVPVMIDYRVRLAKREQQVAKMARAYRKKNGKFDDGFFDELQEWSEKNPLFPEAGKTAPTGSLTTEEQAELEALRKRFVK